MSSGGVERSRHTLDFWTGRYIGHSASHADQDRHDLAVLTVRGVRSTARLRQNPVFLPLDQSPLFGGLDRFRAKRRHMQPANLDFTRFPQWIIVQNH
ncbi:hypothetical protein PAAG_08869 [Paracoccidioides lutzii Pb01]|uniref:Uncharacterized protein n=1 Tax=Paracoccidioides lutzii (strain ATCC MYA-826 / Pb01) TaxID=502779 RepID=C1HDQ8_PARBA|nr:hypothetical protein PAAG_08869 [Paracoccidioides lutzii Pb01]EEH40052.1 hypothetical protein PAAG_08869 [Paracoccidioides lutzii Pb01]